MALAAKLAGQSGGDCLKQVPGGAGSLRNPEPDFYILGSKSYGRNPHYLHAIGLTQIRDLFTIIGDRPELDPARRRSGRWLDATSHVRVATCAPEGPTSLARGGSPCGERPLNFRKPRRGDT